MPRVIDQTRLYGLIVGETKPPGHGEFFIEMRRRAVRYWQSSFLVMLSLPAVVLNLMWLRLEWLMPFVPLVPLAGFAVIGYFKLAFDHAKCPACGDWFLLRSWWGSLYLDGLADGFRLSLSNRRRFRSACVHCGLHETSPPHLPHH